MYERHQKGLEPDHIYVELVMTDSNQQSALSKSKLILL